MRNIFIVLFVFLSCTFLSAQEKQKICLNMIVKNESKVIERCLSSVKPLIDYWVIVDTGSCDGTQEIIKKFMKDIPGELHERPWVNFGHNRTEALQLAKNKGDYVLFIDADEELIYSDNFTRPRLDKDSYYVMTEFSGTKYIRLQMINNHLSWKWVGVVHEYLESTEAKTSDTLAGVVNIPRCEGARSQDPLKFKKDALLIEQALLQEPDNTRYAFYLAQSYRDAGESATAIKCYEKRIAMGGWDQEVFWSKYQTCLLKEGLKADPEEIINGYLECYAFRPNRIEPLYRLALYYRFRNEHLLGYLVSKHALSMPQQKDVLFIEDWIYDYGLLLENAVNAYWIGNYKESAEISRSLLKKNHLPTHVRECVERNLWWAEEMLKPK